MAELADVEVAAAADAARAATTELEALRATSTGSFVSTDDDRDNELKQAREVAREQAAQWVATHPQGHRGGGCAPDDGGGGSLDRRGRAGGWVDGDRGLYRRRGCPSPDRYHSHHGI
jgi:hypothetical protein